MIFITLLKNKSLFSCFLNFYIYLCIVKQSKKLIMKKAYKVNGHTFWTMDDVNKYCIENNFRITNTETIKYKGIAITYLISVVSI